MRLKPEKIEYMAGMIYETLAANKEIEICESREMVIGLIKRVLTEDMKAEDEIEEEAHQRLAPIKEEILRKGVSYDVIFHKAKQKIAQERKMVL